MALGTLGRMSREEKEIKDVRLAKKKKNCQFDLTDQENTTKLLELVRESQPYTR